MSAGLLTQRTARQQLFPNRDRYRKKALRKNRRAFVLPLFFIRFDCIVRRAINKAYKMRQGQIEVICGCMFSGKTEELIRRLKRATYARQKVQVFKHSFDNRYDELNITTHYGLKLPTIACMKAGDIIKAVDNKSQVVGIDEVQFYGDDIVTVIEEIARQDIRVIVSGLDQDFRGEPFGAMPRLLTLAEKVDKLSAICSICGEAATRTQRLLDGHPAPYDSEIVSVGSTEKYEARCRVCHVVPNRPGNRHCSLSPQVEM